MVSVQPSTVVVGSTALVSGTGFTPRNWAFAFWERPDRTSNGIWVFTSGAGMFSFTLGFAPRHGTGTELVTAFDWATRRWAPFTAVSVVPGPIVSTGRLSASPNPVLNGGRTTIFGSGFTPNSQVLVQWRRPDGSMGMVTVFTNTAGVFAFSFTADPRHGCGPRIFTAFDLARRSASPPFVLSVVC
jgi:hypothetical protein